MTREEAIRIDEEEGPQHPPPATKDNTHRPPGPAKRPVEAPRRVAGPAGPAAKRPRASDSGKNKNKGSNKKIDKPTANMGTEDIAALMVALYSASATTCELFVRNIISDCPMSLSEFQAGNVIDKMIASGGASRRSAGSKGIVVNFFSGGGKPPPEKK